MYVSIRMVTYAAEVLDVYVGKFIPGKLFMHGRVSQRSGASFDSIVSKRIDDHKSCCAIIFDFRESVLSMTEIPKQQLGHIHRPVHRSARRYAGLRSGSTVVEVR